VSTPSFGGARVLLFENRRAREFASLVTTYGGVPVVAPAMREVPLESNARTLAFADGLERGDFDLVVLLTGVGTRALLDVVGAVRPTEAFVAALGRVKLLARGPKPLGVLRELGLTAWAVAPEPNTWRELLAVLDARQVELPLHGVRIAVQEYGAPSPELLAGLEARGARVTAVPVYRWALPEDLEPLRAGIHALANGLVDVACFTSATQAVHLWHVSDDMHLGASVLEGLRRTVVVSIGPTTSEELRRHGVRVDLEPSHPKMGFLAREAAEQYVALRSHARPEA
jgi:uroporphyrinogen-III synthase